MTNGRWLPAMFRMTQGCTTSALKLDIKFAMYTVQADWRNEQSNQEAAHIVTVVQTLSGTLFLKNQSEQKQPNKNNKPENHS